MGMSWQFRERCKGDIVRPSVTRFVTNYIALHNIQNKKVGLKALFSSPEWYDYKESNNVAGRLTESIVYNHSFWDWCQMVVNILELVVRVLRMVDGD